MYENTLKEVLKSTTGTDMDSANTVYAIPPYRICLPKVVISSEQCRYEGINCTFDCSLARNFCSAKE